jgi:hypothetical protein
MFDRVVGGNSHADGMGRVDHVDPDRRRRFRPALDLGRPGRASAAARDALAWVAFVILGVVALLGWAMFAIWYQGRQRRLAAAAEAAGLASPPAEQHFPVSIVAVHGILAVTTVVLVFLTAVGVGD